MFELMESGRPPVSTDLQELARPGDVTNEFGRNGVAVPRLDEIDSLTLQHRAKGLPGAAAPNRCDERHFGAEVPHGRGGERRAAGMRARSLRGIDLIHRHGAIGREAADLAHNVKFRGRRSNHQRPGLPESIEIFEKSIPLDQVRSILIHSVAGFAGGRPTRRSAVQGAGSAPGFAWPLATGATRNLTDSHPRCGATRLPVRDHQHPLMAEEEATRSPRASPDRLAHATPQFLIVTGTGLPVRRMLQRSVTM